MNKKRVAALVLAVVLGLSVCMIPIMAAEKVPVYVIGYSQPCKKAFPVADIYNDYNANDVYIDDFSLGGAGNGQTVVLKRFPAFSGREYSLLWVNELQEFFTESYSYVSHQIDCVDNHGNDMGHFTVGFEYVPSSSEVHVRLGSYLKDSSGVFRENFISGPVISAIEGVGQDGGANLCVQIDVYHSMSGEYNIGMYVKYLDLVDGVLTYRNGSGYVLPVPAGYKPVSASIKAINATASADFVCSQYIDSVNVDSLLLCEKLYKSGLTDGELFGYDKGKEDGYNNGYSAGYNAAKNDSNVTQAAIWNIMSMPFDLLSGVLNFEIFGVNVFGAVSAIMTVALVVFILKKVGVF